MKATAKRMPTEEKASRTRILVVEDETDLQELLDYNLARDGFDVTCVDSGEKALKLIRRDPPDMVLLDLMLPGIDGLEICRQIRADAELAHLPLVMLTAKGEEADIVAGLELGADDYVTKPFRVRVLVARLKAVLRRKQSEQDDGGATGEKPIEAGPLRIVPDRHEVLVNGRPVDLTANEFRLVSLLVRHPGRVYTRQQIIDCIHEGFAAVTERSVDVQIVSLRKKLGEAGDDIQTVRGVGYRFRG